MSKITETWMRLKYEEFRTKYFNNMAPPSGLVTFKTDMVTTRWGIANARFIYNPNTQGGIDSNDFKITMTNAWDFPEHVKENTLIHEMIHLTEYFKYPWRFFRFENGRLKTLRYDAHGETFFIPMANKMKAFGFGIEKYSSEEEQSISELNPIVKAKIERKREKGYVIGYLDFSPRSKAKYGYDGYFFKTTEGSLDRILHNTQYTVDYYRLKGEEVYNYLELYKTNSPLLEQYPKCRDSIRGWKYNLHDWNTALEKIRTEGSRLEFLRKINYIKKEEPQTLEQENKVKLFRLKTRQGRTIEFKDTTKEEIKEKLKEMFPNMGEDVMEKLLNNKNNYPLGEERIRRIVREEIENFIENDDSIVINGENGKAKRLGKYEMEYTIA